MVEPDQERQWVERSLAGDTDAYAALVQEHQKMIHALAFRMTGSLEEAEDLAQETFLRAFQQLDTFRHESKFSTWLCQIVVNAGLNWRKRESRRSEIHSQWAERAAAKSEGTTGFPDELSRRVQSALDRLPPKQRAAVVLTIHEEHSHAEAARMLGCSETTVSWRVFVARKKLKKWLEAKSDERR
jgi:RNA polymerase sigma-70 factor, ECF subfamily